MSSKKSATATFILSRGSEMNELSKTYTLSKVDESIFLNNQSTIFCLLYVVFYWTDFSIYNRIGKEESDKKWEKCSHMTCHYHTFASEK